MQEVTIPQRVADYVSPSRTHYWFDELIFLDYQSRSGRLRVNGENKLIAELGAKPCNHCQNCDKKYPCDRNYLADFVQEAYQKWWHEVFELKFMGEDNG